MAKELTKSEEIERSIITKFRKKLWRPFILAIKKYELIAPGDKIAVCISGGKDSMLLAKLMQELHRHSEFDFDLVFLVMDPGYNEKNRKKIEDNAKLLNIPITIFETNIFDVTSSEASGSPCYLCARMRRGYLYSKAKQLGCNKIALGHHKSDVIETTLMSMLNSGQLQGMLPKLKSKNFEGMELIRPLYCILEKDIIGWQTYNNLEFIACACKLTSKSEANEIVSTRKQTKQLIARLKEDNPNVEKNIFKSIENVQLDTMVEYKKDGVRHNNVTGKTE